VSKGERVGNLPTFYFISRTNAKEGICKGVFSNHCFSFNFQLYKKPTSALKVKDITVGKLDKVKKLNDLAAERGQSLAQMAIVWVLRDRVTSALIGASKVEQIEENVKALDHMEFTKEEVKRIEGILK